MGKRNRSQYEADGEDMYSSSGVSQAPETPVDGELLPKDEKQSEGASGSVSELASSKTKVKKHILAWQQLIEMYTELLEIQNIPDLGAHKVEQRERVLKLDILIKEAIKMARVHPKDPVPPKVKRKMNLSHDLKVGEIIKLLDNVKKSVQDERPTENVASKTADSISELDNWKILASIYNEALKIKKALESSVFDSHQPSKEELKSFGEILKPLEAQFRNARKSGKGFNQEMSSSIQEMLEMSHCLSINGVSDCIIYVRDLLKDVSLISKENSMKPDGKQKNQSCENEYWKDLDRIYRKYKIIGLKLKLDFNIKEGEQMILADENLTAAIRIKEQLKDLEKELIVKEKQGKDQDYQRKKHNEGIVKCYDDVHKQQVKVLQSYQAVMNRVVNPEQLQ